MRAHFGGVVRIAVMAPGKDVDRIHLAHLQRLDKGLGVEINPDRVAFQGGVKIEVYLAKAVVCLLHESSFWQIYQGAGLSNFTCISTKSPRF